MKQIICNRKKAIGLVESIVAIVVIGTISVAASPYIKRFNTALKTRNAAHLLIKDYETAVSSATINQNSELKPVQQETESHSVETNSSNTLSSVNPQQIWKSSRFQNPIRLNSDSVQLNRLVSTSLINESTLLGISESGELVSINCTDIDHNEYTGFYAHAPSCPSINSSGGAYGGGTNDMGPARTSEVD